VNAEVVRKSFFEKKMKKVLDRCLRMFYNTEVILYRKDTDRKVAVCIEN